MAKKTSKTRKNTKPILKELPKPPHETKKSGFLDWNNNILVSSFKKIDLNIISIIIMDSLFYFLSGYLILFWLQKIQAKMSAFNLPANIASLGYERTQQLVSQAKSFYYLIIFSFVLVLVIIIFLASILKGIIWAKTTNTKISFKLISKFLALNLIWMGFWFVLVILISVLVEPASALTFMIISVILGLYFTNTLYTIFMKNPSLKSIFNAVKLNITKIHLFSLPYAVILLLLFIIVQLGKLLKFNYSAFLFGLIIVIYAALARYYLSTLVSGIEKIN